MTGNYADGGYWPPERKGVRPATARLLRRLADRIDPWRPRASVRFDANLGLYVSEMNKAKQARKDGE